MRYYASLNATTVSNYNCFEYCGHFLILEKLSSNLERLFCAIWGEWISGLCHCNQSPMGPQSGVETQPLQVTFAAKINSPNRMIIR